MHAAEALELARLAAPAFEGAGLPRLTPEGVTTVQARQVQRLWAGMGVVVDLTVRSSDGAPPVSIIAKRVQWNDASPDNIDIGDRRKRDSYVVEANFYGKGHAEAVWRARCKVPRALLVRNRHDGITIVMSKLQGQSGEIGEKQTRAVLTWLARMHALFWGTRADAAVRDGLQPQGTYWYLDTRPDELAAMSATGLEGRLRLAARAIDERLKSDRLQTICHGDAKAANMLFCEEEPLLCDFQYCGRAPPSKDLAYFLVCGSNVCDALLQRPLIQHYHAELSRELAARGDAPPALSALSDSLDLAACDLGRWMAGWGWWGQDLKPVISRVMDRLDGGSTLGSEEAYVSAVMREYPIATAAT